MIRYELLKMKASFSMQYPYGILGKEECDGDWVPVVVVAPFSNDQGAVDKLAEKCTSLQLSPEQLIDVVSDFISQAVTHT